MVVLSYTDQASGKAYEGDMWREENTTTEVAQAIMKSQAGTFSIENDVLKIRNAWGYEKHFNLRHKVAGTYRCVFAAAKNVERDRDYLLLDLDYS